MRHLFSLIAGVVAAPVAWALLAKGQAGAGDTAAAWAAKHAFNTADLIVPGAYLAGAGILLGLIATLRISPLGPLVAALAYLGLNVGLFIDPFAVRDAVPTKIFGEPIALRTPLFNGTLLAIGALLFIAVFSAQRWRRWPAAVPAAEASAEPEAVAGQRGETAPAAADDTTSESTLVGAGTAQATGGKTGAPPPRHASDDTLPSAPPAD